MNNKGTDLSAQMHRLVCAFVVHKPRSGFLALRPICKGYYFSSNGESASLQTSNTLTTEFLKFCLFVCFVALRPKSTAMVMAGRSVHLITLFSWASLNKQLTSTSCIISKMIS